MAEQELNARIDTVSARRSDAEKAALLQLRRHAGEVGLLVEVLGSLLEFEAGRLPFFSAEEAAGAERELGQLKLAPERQRLWLAYRDAWLALGRLRYPSVPQHAWRAYFARRWGALLNR